MPCAKGAASKLPLESIRGISVGLVNLVTKASSTVAVPASSAFKRSAALSATAFSTVLNRTLPFASVTLKTGLELATISPLVIAWLRYAETSASFSMPDALKISPSLEESVSPESGMAAVSPLITALYLSGSI